MKNTALSSGRFLFLLLSIHLLVSCIAIPVPTSETKVLAGTPVSEEQLSFLKHRVTTRKQVLNMIGAPSLVWENARLYAYHWEMRQGILFWIAGAGTVGGFGKTDIAKRYLLLIQFDEQDRVQRFERTLYPEPGNYGEFLVDWLRSPPSPQSLIPTDTLEQ